MCEKFGIELNPKQNDKEVDDGCINQNLMHPRYEISSAHKFSYLRQMSLLQKPLSFLFLALLHRESEYTDARDKVYALWNLAKDSGDLDLVPDYSLSVRDLYISFTRQYILYHCCLDIICAPQVHCTASLEGGLPSWVPDWRSRSRVNGYLRPEVLPLTPVDELEDLDAPIYRAARSTRAIVKFSENDELLVCRGILIDTVSIVTPVSDDPRDWYPVALKHCRPLGKAILAEQIRRDFWSMIFGDETSPWDFDGEERGEVLRRTQKQPEKLHKTAQIFSGPNVITPNIKGRCLIFTKNGFLGLAPFWVEEGNKLAILFGCNVPILLGSFKEGSTRFYLKGDCFVQGWMRGEMLDFLGEASDQEIAEEWASRMPGIHIY